MQSRNLQPSTACAEVLANIMGEAITMLASHDLTRNLLDFIRLSFSCLRSTLARVALLFSVALLVGCTRRRGGLHGRTRCLRVIHTKTRLTGC